MTWAIEILATIPVASNREPMLVSLVLDRGGRYDFREDNGGDEQARRVTLTFEFTDERKATEVAEILRAQGEYVEGPFTYG